MHKQDAAEGEDDPPWEQVRDHSGEGRDAPVAAYPSRGVKPEEYDKEKQLAEYDPLVPVRVHDVLQKAGTRFLRSTARKAGIRLTWISCPCFGLWYILSIAALQRTALTRSCFAANVSAHAVIAWLGRPALLRPSMQDTTGSKEHPDQNRNVHQALLVVDSSIHASSLGCLAAAYNGTTER